MKEKKNISVNEKSPNIVKKQYMFQVAIRVKSA